MPTSYTDAIKDGITFGQFALGCARAFGALVLMRDDSSDTPIPQKFEVSEYHEKKIESLRLEITEIEQAGDSELEKQMQEERDAERIRLLNSIKKEKSLRAKYDAMLVSAKEWTPPTSEHKGLKTFMIEQIESSIKWDCEGDWAQEGLDRLKETVSVTSYRAQELAKLTKSVAYHTNEHEKEVERTAGRNEWVSALRGSL